MKTFKLIFSLIGFLISILISNAQPNTWTAKTNMPTARAAPTAGVINNKLYVAGGTTCTGINDGLNTLEEYDPSTNIWTTKANMPTPRGSLACAVVNNKLYTIGGHANPGGSSTYYSTVEEYNPSTNTWTTKANLPLPFHSPGAASLNGKIYVIGGWTGYGGWVNVLYEYDPPTNIWTTRASPPESRLASAVVSINGKLYVAGGSNVTNVTSTLFEYDPSTNTWATKATMPVAISQAAAGVINNNLYVFGGHDGSNALNTVYKYDPSTDSWTTKANMPAASNAPSAGVINNKAYVAGGVLISTILNLFVEYTPEGLMTDYDGNNYNTVKIGSQVWMKENLKAIHYSDGISILDGTGIDITGNTTAKYFFNVNDDPVQSNIYGRLYTWGAAMNGASSSNAIPSGIQGVCPVRWHLPSDSEWTTLFSFLNGTAVAGGKMKETGFLHWNTPNTGADNSSGFTALATGNRAPNGNYGDFGNGISIWSTTQNASDKAYNKYLNYNTASIQNYIYDKGTGVSVRCLKNNPASPINLAAAPGNLQILLKWRKNTETDVVKYRIYGGPSANPTTKVDSTSIISDTTKTITGLTNGTTYYYRVTAVDNAGLESGYSNEVSAVPVIPSVLSSLPVRNALAVPLATRDISVTFNTDMNAGTITTGSFLVNGYSSGLQNGTVSYIAGTKTATFTLAAGDTLAWGEIVSVTLTSTIQNSSGSPLTNGFHFQFTVNSALTSANYLTPSVSYTANTGYFDDLYSADFDGDGDMDLCTSNGTSISILKNTGNGTFATQVSYPSGSSCCSRSVALYVADLDNDGDLDIATANEFDSKVAVIKNNGDGTFATPATYVVGGNPWAVFAADLDGDGDNDLILPSCNGNNVAILKNNGNGTFAGVVNYNVGSMHHGISISDIDADGDMDIIAGSHSASNISILKNNGDGTFAAYVSYTTGAQPWGIVSADIDLDGDMDIVTANNGTNDISVLKNNGNGTFASEVRYAAGTAPSGLKVADLDGDGDLDICVANYGSSNISILKNNGSGTFSTFATYAVGTNPAGIFTSDLNRDGMLDIVVSTNTTNSVKIFFGNLAPIAPISLTAAPGNLQINLKWRKNAESDVVKYRIYGGTSANPTTKVDSTTSISDTTKTIIDLANAITYYYRITAVDGGGLESAYSNEASATTVTTAITVTDYDSNIYNTIKIGNQVWMKENLKTTKYNDGTAITHVAGSVTWSGLSTPAYCWYNNNFVTYGAAYGAMYNWYVVDAASNGNKNVCPIGWHVPSSDEFTTLTDYLGGLSVAGGKMKETGTMHWTSPNTGATNESGFSALPSGFLNCTDGTFSNLGIFSIWWSTTPRYSNSDAWIRQTYYDNITAYSGCNGFKHGGFIRCLKNNPASPTNLTATAGNQQVTLIWYKNSETDVVKYQIYGGTSSNPTTKIDSTSNIGDTTKIITGLTNGITYYYRITAVDSAGLVSDYSNSVNTIPENPLPDAAGTISGTGVVCSGSTNISYSVPTISKATSYVWSYSGIDAIINGTTNSVTIDFLSSATSGILTVKGRNSYGDGTVSADYPITVNPLPDAAGTITGTATVCQGQNTVSYSVPTITNATSYVWTLPGGASGSSTTSSISVNFGTSAVSGNVSVKGNNSCGDGTSSNFGVTVNPLPVAAGTITGTATVCQGQNTVSYSVPPITNATTYVWSYSGTGATITGTTNAVTVSYSSSATPGNLSVKGNNSCGDGTISGNYAIAVNPLPVAAGTITGTATVCQGANGVSYLVPIITNATTYVWSYSGTGATITGTTNAVTVSYSSSATPSNLTVKGNNSCGDGTISADYAIVVNPLPVAAGTITGTATVCQGQNTVSYSVPPITNATTYVWSYSGTGATITGTTNAVTVSYSSSATPGNLTVKGNNSCGDGTISGNYAIAVNPLPVAAGTITGTATVCQGANGVSYLVPIITNATSYVWSYSGTGATITGTTNAVTVSYSSSATPGNLTVKGNNSCGDGTISADYAIAVNPLPVAAGTITGTATVCQGQNTVSYSVPPITNATTYVWSYSGTGATITGTTNAVTVSYSSSATPGNLTVKGNNSCGDGTISADYAIAVNPLPVAAGVITGTATVCQGQNTVSYSVPPITNATTYVWSYSGTGATITGTTNAVTVFGTSAVSGNVTVKGNNSCGDGTASDFAVTVNPLPTATISGTTSMCTGGSTNLSVALTGTQPWSITYTDEITPVTLTDIASSPKTIPVSPTSTKTYTITSVSDANVCSNTGTGSAIITVSELPIVSFVTGNNAAIVGIPETYSTQTSMTNYIWTVSGTQGIDYTKIGGTSSDNYISINWLTAGTRNVSVNYTNTDNCTAIASSTLSINVIGLTPSVPLLDSPVNGSTGIISRPTLNWTASPSATGYQLQVSLNSVFSTTVFDDTTITTNYHQIGSLQNNKSFYWRVRAKNSFGWSEFSEVWNFMTFPVPPVTSASIRSSFASPGSSPNGMVWDGRNLWMIDNLETLYKLDTAGNVLFSKNFSGTFSDECDLTWDGTGIWIGESIYANAELSHLKVDTLGNIMDTLSVSYWAHDGLEWDGKYFWLGNYNSSVIYKHKRDGTPILSFGTSGLFGHPTGISYDGLNLWVAGSGEGGTSNQDIFKYSITGSLLSSIDLNPLGIATDYGFYSVAWDGQSLWYASDKQFTIYRLNVPYFHQVPSVPALSLPSNSSYNVPVNTTLTWAEASNADHYQVQVSTNSTFTGIIYDNSTIISNSVAITSLNNNTSYYWRVRAINALGSSAYSAYYSFTTLFLPPAIQANNIVFSSAASTQINLSWARGNGSNCAVFINQGTPGTISPSDNETYVANPVYGFGSQVAISGWYCIYNGVGTSVSVTGLSHNTSYQLIAIEYNGISGMEEYLTNTSSGNPAITTTLKYSQTITFNALSPETICSTPFSLSATASSSLPVSYSSSNEGVAAISGNLVTITGEGSAIITASQAGDDNYNAAPDVQQNLTIYSLPTASLSGTTTICTGGSTNLSVALTGIQPWSITYTDGSTPVTINGINSSPQTISVSPTSEKSYTISNVSDATTCINTGNGSAIITVNPLPTAAISGTSTICAGGSADLSVELTGTQPWSITYTDGTMPVTITDIASSPITIPVGPTSEKSYTISNVSDATTCSNTGSDTATVTVNPLPTATISGTASICTGGSTNLSVELTGTQPWSITYTDGTTPVTIINIDISPKTISVSPSSTKTYSITNVDDANTCSNTGSGSAVITVNPFPADAGTISGTTTVCQGQNLVFYDVPIVNDASGYIWDYSGTGATILVTGNSVTIDFSNTATSGNLTVKGTNSCGDGTVSGNYAISVNPLPGAAGSITGAATACQGESNLSYSVPPVTNATSYIWTLPDGASGSSITNSISVDYGGSAVSGDITVIGNNSCGDGTISSNYAITVDPLPAASGTISGIATISQGQNTVPYSVPPIASATSYVWNYTGTGATITGTGNSITIDFSGTATSGNLTVKGTNSCGDGTVSENYFISNSLDYYVNAATGDNIPANGTLTNPWKTITYALTQISGSGRTVYVSAGSYNTAVGETFPIMIKDGVSLVGAGIDVSIIDAGNTNTVIKCVSITDSTTRVEGFSITGGYLTYPADLLGSGVYISAGSNLEIANNKITGNKTVHHPWRSSRGDGIYIENSSPKILNNIISNNSGDFAEGFGIYLINSSPLIEGNTITENTGWTGAWECGSGLAISGSLSFPKIINNVVSKTGEHGIRCDQSCRPIITNNLVYGNTGDGIQILSSNAILVNNTVSGNGRHGIYNTSLSTDSIFNNIISYNSGYGIYESDASSDPGKVWYNLFYANSLGLYKDEGTTDYYTAGSLNSNVDECKYNISGDPIFEDFANGDYHLRPGSPAIDAGAPTSPLDPDCTRTDIGAIPTINSTFTLTAGVSISVPNTTVCQNADVTFTATPINGGASPIYQWKKNGIDVGTNDSSFSTTTLASNDIIYCVMTSGISCTTGNPDTSNYISITVNPLPVAAGSITGIATVCQGESNISYSVPDITFASSYIWTLPGGATGSSTTNNISIDYGTSAISGNIAVKGNNACGAGTISDNYAITVNPLTTAAGIITGSPTVCQGQLNVAYSVPTIAYATSYIWNYSGTGVTVTPTDNSLIIDFSIVAISGNLTVKGTNSCGDGTVSADYAINVNPLPSAAEIITGTATVCQGQDSVFYSVPIISDVSSYVWDYSGTGATINGTGNSISIDFSSVATSGNLTVKGTSSCGNGPVSDLYSIFVNPQPIATITGTATICTGDSADLSVSLSGIQPWSITYTDGTTSVTLDNIDISPKIISVNPDSTKTFDITSVSDANTCSNIGIGSATVTVNPLPTATISGTASICDGQNATLSVALTGAPPWSLTYTDGTIAVTINNITSSPKTITVNPALTTTYYVTEVNDANCANTGIGSAVITVNSLPNAFAGTDKSISNGTNTTLDGTGSGTGADISYDWQPSSKIESGGSTLAPTTAVLYESTVFTLTVSNTSTTCFASDNIIVTVTGGTLAIQSKTPDQTICEGAGVQLTNIPTGGSGNYTYSWSSDPSGFTSSDQTINVSPGTTTLYTVDVNDGFNTVSGSILVTVNPLPTATISGTASICEGQNATLSVALTGTQPWSFTYSDGTTPVTLNNITSSPHIISVNPASIKTYNITSVNDANCSNSGSGSAMISLNPLPAAAGTITGMASVCQEQANVSFSVSDITNATSYIWSYSGTGATITGTGITVSINFSNAATTGNLTVKGNNSCGDGTVSENYTITVNPLPVAAGTITGAATITQGQNNVPYSVPPIGNATSYLWNYSGTGATITGTGNSITIDFSGTATSGNLIVKGTNSCGDGTVSANYFISNSLDYFVNATTGSNVPTNGTLANPWKTITYALSRISGSGRTVYVAAGTYGTALGESFPILMKNGVSIVGAGIDVSIIEAGGTNTVIKCVSIVDASTKVEGFTIKGGGNVDKGAGIYISAGSVLKIMNNKIINNSTLAWGNGGGLYIINSSPTILYNIISGNSNGSFGLGTIYLSNASPLIKGNRIIGNGGSPSNDDGHALYITSSSLPRVVNNVIANNFGIGIACYSPAKIINNTISENGDDGILISSTPDSIFNNIISLNGGYGIRESGTSSDPGKVWYNLFYANNSGLYYNEGSTAYYTASSLNTDVAECKYNIDGDPMFADKANNDYHLQTGSPAIDAGAPTSPLDPDCSRADMGALPTDNPVVNLPVGVSISVPNTTICQNDNVIFTATPTNGGTSPIYQWKKNGIDVGTNDSNFSTITLANNDIIYCVMTSGIPCATGNPDTSNSISMTVNPLPDAAGTITGIADVCQGAGSVSYSVPDIANATSYIWTLPTGATGSSTTNSILVDYGAGAVSGNITVKGNNTCGDGTISTFGVTLNLPTGTAGTITGAATVCRGQNPELYSVPTISDATSYIWNYSGTGATINGTGNSVTIDFSNTATSGNLTVKGTNSCGDGTVSDSYAISVNPFPGDPDAITGSTTVCQGETNVFYSIPIISDASDYAWGYSGTGATITGSSNTVSIDFSNTATPGNLTVKGTNSCGDGTISGNHVIAVNPLPDAAGTITGTAAVCQGENNVSYSVPTITNATTYIWTLPFGATGSSTTNSILVDYGTVAVSGNFTVKGNNACGDGTSSTFGVTVDLPAGPAGTITGTTTVCQGETNISYSVPAISEATSYIWDYSGTGASISGNGTGITIGFSNAASSGNLTVKGNNSCGDGMVSDNYSITVNPLPAAAGLITGLAAVCQGQNLVSYSILIISDATSYIWDYSGTGAVITGTDSSVSIDFSNTATSGNLTVKGTNSCGDGITSGNHIITVNPLPDAAGTITGAETVCQGENNVNYSVPGITNATDYKWTLPSGATGSSTTNSILVNYGSSAVSGNITVKGNNGCGDGDSATFGVTVNLSSGPAGTIAGTPGICRGVTNVSYSVPVISEATSYTWEYSGSGATISGNGNDISIDFSSTATSGNLTVKGINSCADGTVSVNYPITVKNFPAAAGVITGNSAVCQEQTRVSYSVPIINNASVYTWEYSGTGATITGNSNSIIIDYSITATSGNLKVKGTNSCGDGPLSGNYSITVNSLPVSPGSITGTAVVCLGTNNVSYSIPTIINAANYIWTLPGSATGSSTTNSILVSYGTGAVSGDITVKGNNSCGVGTASTFGVTVDLPAGSAGTITGASTVCQGQTNVTYSVPAISEAASYNWTLPGGVNGNSTSNNISVNFDAGAVSGEIRVKAQNECGEGTESSLAVTIKDAVFPKIKTKWGEILICYNLGDSIQQFQWYKNDISIQGATAQFFETHKENGSYYVITTDAIGCSNQSNIIEFAPFASYSIYPNPAFENIEISLQDENVGEVTILILNSVGTAIKTFTASKTGVDFNSKLSISGLLPAVYMVEIKMGGQHLMYNKLVVTKR
jgi:uncharacterized protein (TIGR02145 family)